MEIHKEIIKGTFKRNSGRLYHELRKVRITPDFQKSPLASVLIETGDTKVICAVSNLEKVPGFITQQGHGWITAEYSLLPSSTSERSAREASIGKVSGRTAELQRLIGRCLRSVVDLDKIGARTLYIDCDTIQADGGTRTASITGGFVALAMALSRLKECGDIEHPSIPIRDYVAAVSVGIMDSGEILLDLDYYEDRNAAVDMNIVRTGEGRYIELQGGAEKMPFTDEQLGEMIKTANIGIDDLIKKQKEILKDYIEF
jgi:ribonuclease PH